MILSAVLLSDLDLSTLTEQHKDIVRTIGVRSLKGADIAKSLPTPVQPDGGGFKGSLSTLVKLRFLTNTSQAGYRLTDKGTEALHHLQQT